jgi:hypothetical protein
MGEKRARASMHRLRPRRAWFAPARAPRPEPRRAWTCLAASLALAACAGAPVPATVWLRLPSTLPGAEVASAAAAAPAGADAGRPEVWQLMLPVSMPAHLDSDRVFVPRTAAGAWVQPLAGARWIEPLRDAVPRLLREDLAARLQRAGGGTIWTAPLPPGLAPARQLRVEITAMEVATDGRALVTRARWSVADPAGGVRGPVQHEAGFATAPVGGADPEAWAVAHRQAVRGVAERIAATMAPP